MHCRRTTAARRSDAVDNALFGAASALVASLPTFGNSSHSNKLGWRFLRYARRVIPKTIRRMRTISTGFPSCWEKSPEPHAITLRTSIIGHELQSKGGLLEWFLSQQEQCRCYTRAIFSGFPTIVLADLIRDVVIPRPDLHGVYHVAARPISKFDLLRLVAERYGKKIELIPDDRASPDRTLVAARFEKATGYVAPDWPTLVDLMYCDRFGSTRT